MLRDAGGPDDAPATHVLVFRTLGAVERRGLLKRRGRAKDAEPEPEPTPVSTSRATVIHAAPLPDAVSAERWMRDGARTDHAAAALVVLNRALHAHRIASFDASIFEVSGGQALATRVGYGVGEQVAEGRWSAALELPPPGERRRRRVAVLRPQERLARLLGAKETPLACEELTLRARLDVDGERWREAALMLRVGLEAALAELAAEQPIGDVATRLGELRESRGAVGEAANAAIAGELDSEQRESVERVLTRLEAALRARAVSGT